MKAIKTVGSNRLALLSDVPIPHVRADRILVRNEAVALNPADWKFVDLVPCTGAMVGCDYAGVVEDVGHDLTVAFKKGDRVAGFVHGISPSDPESGAFSEYVLAKTGCSLKIPDRMSFENACALGVGITTVGQAMYESLELPWPGSPGKRTPVLIYGGSTATGTLAIQMAKLSGLEVITTCSPRNFSLVKSLGADAVFDYHAPTCGSEIRKYTDDSLYYALDCYSEEISVRICAAALASSPPPSGQKIRLGTIAPLDSGRKDVEHLSTFGHAAFGEEFTILGHTIPANPKHYEFATKFFKLAEGLLAEDKLKPHPIEIRPQGLGGVLSGLEDLRSEKVSGKKLVYRIADTSEDLGVEGSST